MTAKNIPWSLAENGILLERVKENCDSRGRPRWAYVAKGLPGRTAQEARCRYRRITDARVRRERGERFRNKCHACGQPRRGHVCPGVKSTRDAASSQDIDDDFDEDFGEEEDELGGPSDALPVDPEAADALGLGPLAPVLATAGILGEKTKASKPKKKVTIASPPSLPSAAEGAASESEEDKEEEEEYPALPDMVPIQRTPSLAQFPLMDDDLSAWLQNAWNASTVGEQLRRLGSMSTYIDTYYDDLASKQSSSPLPPVGAPEIECF